MDAGSARYADVTCAIASGASGGTIRIEQTIDAGGRGQIAHLTRSRTMAVKSTLHARECRGITNRFRGIRAIRIRETLNAFLQSGAADGRRSGTIGGGRATRERRNLTSFGEGVTKREHRISAAGRAVGTAGALHASVSVTSGSGARAIAIGHTGNADLRRYQTSHVRRGTMLIFIAFDADQGSKIASRSARTAAIGVV